MCVLLFLLACCSKEQSRHVQAENPSQAVAGDTSLNLKFTSGAGPIFEDSKGNVWVGSPHEGACRYDGQSMVYLTSKEGLPDDQIRSIQEDENGNIWFGTAKGVGSYDGEKITNYRLSTNGEWEKTGQDLWFNAGIKEGVYRYDGQALSYLAFPKPKITNPNNVYHVTCLSEGKNDMLWIGTYAGIFGFDGTRFTTINDESLGLNAETGALHIRSLLEDSKGRLWIGNNGIGVLLRAGGVTVNFSEQNQLIHPSSSKQGEKSPAGTLEHVFAIEEDKDGNIWFGDRDTGAWKYDGDSMTNYSRDAGLSHDFVQAIYQGRNGELWFGLADGNVFKFNGKTFDKQF